MFEQRHLEAGSAGVALITGFIGLEMARRFRRGFDAAACCVTAGTSRLDAFEETADVA